MKQRQTAIRTVVTLLLSLALTLASASLLAACSAQKESGETAAATAADDAAGHTDAGSDAKTDASSENARAAGALHVKGAHLVDSRGTVVQLRGVSTHGIAWFPDYINEACFQQLHDEWNVNTVRLAMYTAESGGYCTDGDKAHLKALIDKGVRCATDQDMYVIIDWHILSDGDPNTYLEEARSFFREMSAKYVDHSNVLYELCNEPNGSVTWPEIKSYAEQIIPVIRSNDPDAVILVGTPNWSQYADQAAADPITDYDNILYTLHFYAATHTDALRSTLTAAAEKGLPLFVSEYGICDASGSGAIDEQQADRWIALLDRYGISYVAWNLSNKAETSALIKSGCTKTSGFTSDDLSDSGKWLYRTLTGASPASSASSASPASPGAAPTEQAPASDRSDSASGGSQSGSSPTAAASLTYTAKLTNTWASDGHTYYQYDLTVKNRTRKACERWTVQLHFSGAVTLTDGWNGVYKVSGSRLTISSKDYNGQLAAGGETGNIGFIVKGDPGIKLK